MPNGVMTEGRQVFVASLKGRAPPGAPPSDHLADQARQALANGVEVLKEGDATGAHITRLSRRAASAGAR